MRRGLLRVFARACPSREPTDPDQASVAQRQSNWSNEPVVGGSSPSGRAMNKLYVIGRADLDPGLLCAQLGHAAIAFALRHPALGANWEGNLIMLQVPDRAALEALQLVLEPEGAVGFREPDRHAPDFLGDELTALAVMPQPATARRVLAPLQLAFADQRLPRGPGLARATLRTSLAK